MTGLLYGSDQQADAGEAPGSRNPVLQGQAAAVGFSNLTAQGQTNPTTVGFGGKDGHEQIRRIGQTGPGVPHVDPDVPTSRLPAEDNFWAG